VCLLAAVEADSEEKVRRLAAVEADSGEKVRKLSGKCESSSCDESCTVSAAAGFVCVCIVLRLVPYPVRYRCADIVMYLCVLCKGILHSQCKWKCRCFGVFQVG
jgi:hypothetical protein